MRNPAYFSGATPPLGIRCIFEVDSNFITPVARDQILVIEDANEDEQDLRYDVHRSHRRPRTRPRYKRGRLISAGPAVGNLLADQRNFPGLLN